MRTKEELINLIEETLDVHFPLAYRQFLLEQGSATIANYRILGLPEKPEKPEEEKLSLSEKLKRLREKQEESRKRPQEKRTKPRTTQISVLEATLLLRQKRPDLPQTLVAIVFKKALTDGKDKAMCIDTAKTQGDDALLFEVSDVNQEGAIKRKIGQPN